MEASSNVDIFQIQRIQIGLVRLILMGILLWKHKVIAGLKGAGRKWQKLALCASEMDSEMDLKAVRFWDAVY